MTEADQLKILRSTSETTRLLRRVYDFSFEPNLDASPLFKPEAGTSCEVFAKRATGCLFCLCQNSQWKERPLLFVSSEGQAGIIGKNLNAGLSIIVAMPYWQECLKFSAGGQLSEMRRAVSLLEVDYLQQEPNLNSIRQTLQKHLALENITDPPLSLYTVVKEISPSFPAFASDNSKFDSLFNKFKVEANPVWRRQLAGQS